MKRIETLPAFYDLMRQTKVIRKDLVGQRVQNNPVSPQLILPLRHALEALEDIPQNKGQYQLALDDTKKVSLDLSYEMDELKKDIFFMENDEAAFEDLLAKLHPKLTTEAQPILNELSSVSFDNFITDRDGTVNNYCGRYATSIQSIYNALYLIRFAQNRTKNAVILTSAPLDNVGLADISIAPGNIFIYAGSKGREYLNGKGERCVFPIKKEKQEKLTALNSFLADLVKKPEYAPFAMIGSGLQFKFGQTTIARQDISGSIPADESDRLLLITRNLVKKIDPEEKFFRIEDTGKDIEIILTVDGKKSNEAKDFDKGDGLNFLNKDLRLGLKKARNLICGDTRSDVPMVRASMELSQHTWTIFVTQDEALKEEVRTACPQSFFVSTPDTLVTILNSLGRHEPRKECYE